MLRFFFRTLRSALHALRRNIMRSALTILGIIIGIAAVIAMIEIGNGSSTMIAKTIASMGADTLMIFPGSTSFGAASAGSGSAITLTPQDGDAILRDCPDTRAMAPMVRARCQIVYGNRNYLPGSIYGTTPAFLTVRDWTDLAEGTAFSDQDVRNASKVCLLGRTTTQQLFDNDSPVGKEIRINNVAFKVLGVLSSKGANMMGMDQDDIVLAPWTTIKYRVVGTSATVANQSAAAASSSTSISTAVDTETDQLYPEAALSLYPVASPTEIADTPLPVRFTNVDQLLVAAYGTEATAAADREVTDLLRERHRLAAAAPDDFTIRDMAEITKTLSATSEVTTQLLLMVALISLLVGGVGIMNIMLVSVTERTREIGLRMAVGARGVDILFQFVVEAVVLCLLGGIVGILVGCGGSSMVAHFKHWPVQISVTGILAAVGVSVLVGLVFGSYPAWKAARLDPIEALRYE